MLGLVLALLMLSGCLFGADCAYRIVFENRLDRAVVVSALGQKVPIDGCSVRSLEYMGPTYGSAVPVTVEDPSGKTLYRTQVQARNAAESARIGVVIPSGTQDVCPASAATFTVHIWNRSAETIELYENGKSVGRIDADRDSRFGPFVGSYPDFGGLTYRKGNDQERPLAAAQLSVYYHIGEVPEYELGIS
jgi:hypothetical protein